MDSLAVDAEYHRLFLQSLEDLPLCWPGFREEGSLNQDGRCHVVLGETHGYFSIVLMCWIAERDLVRIACLGAEKGFNGLQIVFAYAMTPQESIDVFLGDVIGCERPIWSRKPDSLIVRLKIQWCCQDTSSLLLLMGTNRLGQTIVACNVARSAESARPCI